MRLTTIERLRRLKIHKHRKVLIICNAYTARIIYSWVLEELGPHEIKIQPQAAALVGAILWFSAFTAALQKP